jgi:hypothetical protein
MRFGVEIGLRIIFSKCQCSYTPKISHLLPTTEIGQKIQFYFISHIHTINHQKKKKKKRNLESRGRVSERIKGPIEIKILGAEVGPEGIIGGGRSKLVADAGCSGSVFGA